MPQPPGIIDKVNFVIKEWSYGCDGPWWLYVETALPALLEAFVSFEEFDPANIVRSFARPKGLRSLRHGRRGKRGGKRGGGIPDYNDMIGDYFREESGLGERHVSSGVQHLWRFLGLAERALFYWMVADLAADFAFRWTSLIHREFNCGTPGPKPGAWTVNDTGAIPIVGWQGPGVGTVDYTTDYAGGIFVGPGGNFSCIDPMHVIFACHALNTNLGPNLLEIGLSTGPHFPNIGPNAGASFIGPGVASLFVEIEVPGDTVVVPAIRAANLDNHFTGLMMFAWKLDRG